MIGRTPRSTLTDTHVPYTTLFRSLRDTPETKRRTELRGHLALATNALRRGLLDEAAKEAEAALEIDERSADANTLLAVVEDRRGNNERAGDRKSTRLNSSH